jgi:GNAT superfamily N-acetyltransferase
VTGTVRVRRGARDDSAAAAELWLRARRAAIPSIPPPAHTDDEVRGWFATQVAEECEVWLAEDEWGRLAGVLVLHGEWLDQLYVEPGRTGQGIGGALMAVAKRERPSGLRLWTFASNTGAQRFYERHGFREVERTDGAGNEEGAPDILYAWKGAS